ncbi:DUF4974 domain-containing protein [Puteibacter caeruleilacunae]|nr:DUF4974 domain-containing protein [Puteibacter caeruleilacunae]
MEEKKLGDHIIDHLNNEKKESPELDLWLEEAEENRNTLSRYKRIWEESRTLSENKSFNAIKAWTKVDGRLQSKKIIRRRFTAAAYAVSGMAASILIILGLYLFTNIVPQTDQVVKVATAYGSRSEVELPDGTVVSLNAGSSLEYKRSDGIREVIFSGEGFFDVEKAKDPFVIQTADGYELKVLGTRFNLTAYKNDMQITAALVEGKVHISSPEKKELYLKPGQVAEYDKTNKGLKYVKSDVGRMTGWMDDKIFLDGMKVAELAQRLERRFDVVITVNLKNPGDYHFTGVLQEETIGNVMEALHYSSGLNYTIKGKNIILTD